MLIEKKGLKFNPDTADWHKSSRSHGAYDCVQVALITDGTGAHVGVATRDSKNPGDSVQIFDVPEWRAFIGGVKDSEFDI